MAGEVKGRGAGGVGGLGGMVSPVTLDDLTADLIWPRLLRAAALALNPSRLGIGFFAVVGLMLVWSAARAIAGPEVDFVGERWEALGGVLGSVARLDAEGVGRGLYRAFIAAPAALLSAAPVATILGAALAVTIAAVAGGAISRMTACEFSLGMSVPWPQGLAFAIKRLRSLLGALLGPVMLVWVIAGLIAVGGVLLRVPWLNVVAGVFYGVTLLLGIAGALMMGAYLLAKPMLVPAVACEGGDAIDAVQRSYAYVFAKPLRLLAYLAVLLLEGALILLSVGSVAWGAAELAERASGALAGEYGRGTLASVGRGDTQTAAELGAAASATAWFVRMWLAALWALVAGYALTFYFTASTLLYLAMRRVADGQDMNELWLEGRSGLATPLAAPATAASSAAGERTELE